jgi:hypothetical protein
MEQTLGHEGHHSSDSEITFEIPRPNDNPYEAKVNRTRQLVSYCITIGTLVLLTTALDNPMSLAFWRRCIPPA